MKHTPRITRGLSVRDSVLCYLRESHPALAAFWLDDAATDVSSVSIEAHCDAVYALHLVGAEDLVCAEAPGAFARVLRGHSLPGWAAESGSFLSVHNCAYAFGALNLLSATRDGLYPTALSGRVPAFAQLVRGRPPRLAYPKKLSHHAWRVSHWLGGIPSIFLSLARSGAGGAESARYADDALEATDACLDPETGLIRLYRVPAAQAVFRTLYRLRHDPDLGDLGGIAHVLWVNHASGRRYVAPEAVLARAMQAFETRRPFMETTPYCLDFDVVQAVRTCLGQTGGGGGALAPRAAEMARDLHRFLIDRLDAGYSLHRLPGALATLHECAWLTGEPTGLGTEPIDIIARAYWL